MRIIMLIAAFLLVIPPVMAAEENNQATTLEINAQQEVKAEPDIATISAGVLTVAKTAEGAMKDNATKMNALFAALKKAGIEAKDQQTSGITVNPQYLYVENKAPQITGYQANNSLNVTLRDLKNIGPVLDALIAQGANQINGPSFTLDNPDALLDKARKDAVDKAHKRAEIYASATGMKIKRIRSISESTSVGMPPPYPMMARKMMAMAVAAPAEATPVASGQVNLSVNVNITYELE
jgi:uncharacterized protein YggE